MSAIPAAAIGGAVGALVLIALSFFLIWFCIFRRKNASRTSDETGSSDPSTQGMFKSQLPSLSLSLSLSVDFSWVRNDSIEGRNVAIELSMREARRFEMEELAQATKSFTNKSLIGIGKFGEVYKGLLQDGVLVAIKKRPGLPTQEFVNEVSYNNSFNVWLEHTCFEKAYNVYFSTGSLSIVYQSS